MSVTEEDQLAETVYLSLLSLNNEHDSKLEAIAAAKRRISIEFDQNIALAYSVYWEAVLGALKDGWTIVDLEKYIAQKGTPPRGIL